MKDFVLLMHNDAPDGGLARPPAEWNAYIDGLTAAGAFEGGGSIGDGFCLKKSGAPPEITGCLSGYIRIMARDLDHARELVRGNPVLEAGGTVEIRELPKE